MISRSSEYALRTLTFLAQQQEQCFHLARDMAEVLGIPAPFLGKVLQPLVTCGILCSQRGRSGGFKLARPAQDITLREVVETQESLSVVQRCILGDAACSDERPCPFHEYWRSTADGLVDLLARTTLRDLADHRLSHPESTYPFPLSTDLASSTHRQQRSRPSGARPIAAI
jgi:Rrf2 family protein